MNLIRCYCFRPFDTSVIVIQLNCRGKCTAYTYTIASHVIRFSISLFINIVSVLHFCRIVIPELEDIAYFYPLSGDEFLSGGMHISFFCKSDVAFNVYLIITINIHVKKIAVLFVGTTICVYNSAQRVIAHYDEFNILFHRFFYSDRRNESRHAMQCMDYFFRSSMTQFNRFCKVF